jgi:N-acetyl-D-muramate 6-phosphate phosphatase
MTAVLFDLDGTLVDTAPDLGYALNLQREKHGLPPLDDQHIRPYASHGSRGLLAVGFGLTPSDERFSTMRDEYLDIYNQVFTRSPCLFEGMVEVLHSLEQRKILWGIVTNKPRRFTIPLLQSMGLQTRAASIVSGDDAPQPKPSPQTLLMACEQMRVITSDCLYVGDAERDIIAGKAAGMKTVVALFGYIDVDDKPDAWGADMMIHQATDLIDLV